MDMFMPLWSKQMLEYGTSIGVFELGVALALKRLHHQRLPEVIPFKFS